MKKIIVLIFSGVFLFGISCKKSSSSTTTPTTSVQKGISYPDSIYYGKSILTFPDSTILSTTQNYGLAAILEKDANLTLVFTNLSPTDTSTGHMPVWFYNSTTNGWAVQNYTTSNTQKFISSQTGKIDVQMSFFAYGMKGKCKIDFYENSSAITRTKYLKWQ